jgi:cellulose synthase/poly-beta-1,6-N-acetylglucosamine synthase-like glycosyltransferase
LRVAEDVDLVWRLDAAGWRVRYAPEIVVEHASRLTVRSWLGRIYLYGTGGAPLAQRHGARVAPAVLSPAYLVAAVGLTAQRRWSGLIVVTAFGYTASRVGTTIGQVPRRQFIAAGLAMRGLGWALVQESSLLLRHWWPLTALWLPHSRRIRRAAVAAMIVDIMRSDRDDDRDQYLVARRLEDLAYGAGLWVGALKARSVIALVPHVVGTWRSQGRRWRMLGTSKAAYGAQ